MNITFLSALAVIVGAAWVMVFWKAADVDGQPRFLWAGLSLGVFLVTWWIFGCGWLGVTLAQLGLGIGVAVGRAVMSIKTAR